MPGRQEPFITNRIYHVFNRSFDSQRIFIDLDYCNHFIKIFKYYRSTKATVSLSKLSGLNEYLQRKIETEIALKKYFRVEILAYCLMPTHFHFLLKQKISSGISKFLSDITNAFTRFYNIQNQRVGPLFVATFKSVTVRSEEQLKHVSRYIHLNPYSSQLVENAADLINYPWSSYKDYLFKNQNKIVDRDLVMKFFADDDKRYRSFVENNADYQRNLERIKYTKKW